MADYQNPLQQNVSLVKFNTWRVGGLAHQLYEPANLADLAHFLPTLATDDHPIWLGLGSNVLIRDGGISNTVILTSPGLNTLELLDDATFRAEAGVTCAKVAKFCVKHHFSKGTFFAGIPGTVGGALAMNAGAFGGETWENVVAVETIDRDGEIRLRTPSEYQIGYRSVRGPGLTDGSPEWFVAGHFKLPIGDGPASEQSIKELLKRRSETQPIGLPSCGSVFRNPPGDYAARLIEDCGLKGYEIGGAQVSPKHANFIINTGTASADDLEKLINYVREVVKDKKGVELVPEVRFLGAP